MLAITTVRNPDGRLAPALALIHDLPAMSPLARRLIAMISTPGEGASLVEVANWVEKDTLISGQVLGLANSALYGRSQPILSVRLAVSRLGFNPLRNLILGASLSRLWTVLPTPDVWSPAHFNAHSLATAILSELLASALSPQDMELAFLAGLFHDTGRLIIAVLLRNDPNRLDRLYREEHERLEEVEMQFLGFTHSEISAEIVHHWNLPPAIEEAVRYHENPGAEPGGNPVPLSELVHAADHYVDCHGFSINGQAKDGEAQARAEAKLGPVLHQDLLSQFRQELDALLGVI